ncbi:DUF4340 domain-containing protein [Coraliomargarita sp. SDUM461004]|uniref:DUF4340 domain-containing protein n=1 Tax=Thalassobacterium sedimentorum TaxID=3041258 RepID=A0ABU1AGJ3_9BACT|nr:DUF4340 domain-containing protein [Coraliomargarita sp. SDUM461004]MDQ8193905.1 DUF4340 domain-containing protein [Coraliomargarita sp. SDUM461004]
MRFKFTVFLLALNIITFGLIAYLSKQANQVEITQSGLSGQIGRELIDADRIELHGRGLESPRILERKGSTWSITQPMQWSANYFAINRILNQLQFLEEDASFPVDEIEKTGQTLADYGLDDPLLKLVIAEGKETISLSIGTLTEIGNNVYLLGPNGREIFVVNRQVIDGLLVGLNDLRTREVFDIPVFEVDALGLQIRSESTADGSSLKVRLARSNGEWRFEAPLAAKADPTLVDNTINTLTAAKVGRFIEEDELDPVLQGLETPFMRVTIHGNKRRQTLIIGNLAPDAKGPPEYFAKLEDNPAVFTLLARPFDALREAQEALRERNFINFDHSKLSAINISENGRKIRLQKLETGERDWQVLESKGEDEIQPHRADPVIMTRLMQDLSNLRASGFAVDAPSPSDTERLGFNNPRRIVTLSFSEGPPLILTLAHPEDDSKDANESLYAKTNQADFIYQVERRHTLDMIPLNTSYYRNRTLDTLPSAARISALKLTNLSTKETIFDYKLPQENIRWDNLLEQLESNRGQHIRVLLDAVRNFQVKSYLRDSYAAAYILDSDKTLPWMFKLSATIQLPGGETDRTETREYVFTKRLSGNIQVAGSSQHNTIFEIPQPLLDALYELTEDMEKPPEAKGEEVPDPKKIPPVAKPQAPASEIEE